MFEQSLALTSPVLCLGAVALVMLLFAATQTNFQLDTTVFVVQIQWHQGKSTLLDLADQFADFFGMQQQFAGARWVRLGVR